MDRYHWFGRAGRHAVIQQVHALHPAALIVVFAAIVIVSLFDLEDHGVAVVGNISREIPLPALQVGFTSTTSLRSFRALAVAVIGYTESNTVSEQFADEHAYDINSNQSWSPSAPPYLFGLL